MMLAARRRATIIERLRREHEVRVSVLSQQLHVSEETIRRDLALLELEGIAERNHGGALLVSQPAVVKPLSERRTKNHVEKQAIAAYAYQYVKPGSVIMIDAGTTTSLFAQHIAALSNVTVITHALQIAAYLSDYSGVELVVAGGKVSKANLSMSGPFVEEALAAYNAGQVFLGTSGLTPEQGLTTSDIHEAEVKKAMLRPGREVIVLADHTKIGSVAMVTFAQVADVHRLITSELADREILERLAQCGVTVEVCAVPEEIDDEHHARDSIY